MCVFVCFCGSGIQLSATYISQVSGKRPTESTIRNSRIPPGVYTNFSGKLAPSPDSEVQSREIQAKRTCFTTRNGNLRTMSLSKMQGNGLLRDSATAQKRAGGISHKSALYQTYTTDWRRVKEPVKIKHIFRQLALQRLVYFFKIT
jgi:hypothetical protein